DRAGRAPALDDHAVGLSHLRQFSGALRDHAVKRNGAVADGQWHLRDLVRRGARRIPALAAHRPGRHLDRLPGCVYRGALAADALLHVRLETPTARNALSGHADVVRWSDVRGRGAAARIPAAA